MPYVLHFSHHTTTLVPGKPQLLSQTRAVTRPWLIEDFVIALAYHALLLTKLEPPGLGPSSLSHIRQVLQRAPTLPLKQSQRVGWGREKKNSTPRTPSGSFLYTPQPLPPPAKHRKTRSLSHSSLQKTNRGRVKGMWYMVTFGVEKQHFYKKKKKFTIYIGKRGMWYAMTKVVQRPWRWVGWGAVLRWVWEGNRTSSSSWLFSPSSREIRL